MPFQSSKTKVPNHNRITWLIIRGENRIREKTRRMEEFWKADATENETIGEF